MMHVNAVSHKKEKKPEPLYGKKMRKENKK